MLKIFQDRLNIYSAFCKYIEEAKLTNPRGLVVSKVQEEFYENYDKDSCPIVVLQKGPFSLLKFDVDQFSIVMPTAFDLQLIAIDYSLKSFVEADLIAEELLSGAIDAISNGLEKDNNTKDLMKQIEVQTIQWGPSEVNSNLYFSDIRAVIVCVLKYPF